MFVPLWWVRVIQRWTVVANVYGWESSRRILYWKQAIITQWIICECSSTMRLFSANAFFSNIKLFSLVTEPLFQINKWFHPRVFFFSFKLMFVYYTTRCTADYIKFIRRNCFNSDRINYYCVHWWMNGQTTHRPVRLKVSNYVFTRRVITLCKNR